MASAKPNFKKKAPSLKQDYSSDHDQQAPLDFHPQRQSQSSAPNNDEDSEMDALEFVEKHCFFAEAEEDD